MADDQATDEDAFIASQSALFEAAVQELVTERLAPLESRIAALEEQVAALQHRLGEHD